MKIVCILFLLFSIKLYAIIKKFLCQCLKFNSMSFEFTYVFKQIKNSNLNKIELFFLENNVTFLLITTYNKTNAICLFLIDMYYII